MRRVAFTTAVSLLVSGLTVAADVVPKAIDRYCVSCHNTEDWAGGLDLTSLDPTHVAEEAEHWEKVVRKLRAGMMPPAGEPRPSRKESAAIVSALERRLDEQTR